MNEHDFEEKLRALTAGLARPDPTSGWKADILGQARHAREQAAPRAPRWLLTVLGAVWLGIAVLHFTTPGGPASPVQADRTTTGVALDAPAHGAPWPTLMAYHSNPELLDLP